MSIAGAGFGSDRVKRLGLGSTGICLVTGLAAPAHAATVAPDGITTVDSVVVTAARPQLPTLSAKVLDTPQSINVVPAEILRNENVSSLQEALKNVPGVTLNAGEGGSHGDDVNLRGFPASDDFFLDGLRDTGFYTRDAFDVESLEIYKGPASTLFGRGSTGGVINQVSKTPKLDDFYTAFLTGGSNDEGRAVVDLNQRLSDTSAVRLDALGYSANVAGRDFVLNRRVGVAPSVAFGIGQPTTVTVNYLHQSENDVPDYGIPFVAGRPAPVPRNLYYGLTSDDRIRSDVNVLTGRVTHTFSDDLVFTDAARFGNYGFDTRQTAPHYSDAPGATEPTAATPPDSILIYRDRPSEGGVIRTFINQADLTYKTHTGPIAHTFVFGVDLSRETADLIRYTNQIDQIAPTPLLDPNPHEAFPGHQDTIRQLPDTTTTTEGGLILDTASLGEHWALTAGVRYDRFAATFDEPISGASFAHNDYILSPRAALVYKPTRDTSLYFSYGTSFDPSAENLSLAARNADLGPEKDRTFEFGGKASVLNEQLSLTAAAFRTEQTNARVGDPLNATLQALDGDDRVLGFELDAIGHLTRHWEVLAGYTYTDARTVSSTDPLQVGQLLPNTGHNQANLFTTYEGAGDIWKVGLGVNYLGKRQADTDGRDEVPGYVTFDALASYRISRQVTIQLNGYNLLDRYYFTNSYDTSPVENHVIPGAGRTVTVSAVLRY